MLPRPKAPEQAPLPHRYDESQPPRAGDQPPPPGRGQIPLTGQVDEVDSRAEQVDGVRQASTIIIGDIAIIGLEVVSGNKFQIVEQNVASAIKEEFAAVTSVYISSNPDLYDQIRTISDRIGRNQPTETVLDDLYDIWEKIRNQ